MNEYYENNGNLMSFTVVDFAKYIKFMATDRLLFSRWLFSGLSITIRKQTWSPSNRACSIYIKTPPRTGPRRHHDPLGVSKRDNADHEPHQQFLRYYGTWGGKHPAERYAGVCVRKKGELVLKKNRTFEFSGSVSSGKFEFHGKSLFDYDMFKGKNENH